MHIQISAVLLAAGSSTRMGQLKQILPIGDKPAIRHCLDSIIESGIKDMVVVLGEQCPEVLKVINDLPVKVEFNNEPQSEMAGSVRIGFRAVDADSSGVLVALSDHPLVSVKTIKMLIDFHKQDPNKIIIHLYEGKRGHPTLFPGYIIEEIFTSQSLRDIIKKDPERLRFINIPDEGVILDMDTMEDYEIVCEKVVKK